MNKWAWIPPIGAGIGVLIWGIYTAAVLGSIARVCGQYPSGSWEYVYCVSLYSFTTSEALITGIWWIIAGALGIIGGFMARQKTLPLVAARKYADVKIPLFLWGIVASICVGAGGLLILQAIFILIGENTK